MRCRRRQWQRHRARHAPCAPGRARWRSWSSAGSTGTERLLDGGEVLQGREEAVDVLGAANLGDEVAHLLRDRQQALVLVVVAVGRARETTTVSDPRILFPHDDGVQTLPRNARDSRRETRVRDAVARGFDRATARTFSSSINIATLKRSESSDAMVTAWCSPARHTLSRHRTMPNGLFLLLTRASKRRRVLTTRRAPMNAGRVERVDPEVPKATMHYTPVL